MVESARHPHPQARPLQPGRVGYNLAAILLTKVTHYAKTNVSTENPPPGASAWFSIPHGHRWRTEGDQTSPAEGSLSPGSADEQPCEEDQLEELIVGRREATAHARAMIKGSTSEANR